MAREGKARRRNDLTEGNVEKKMILFALPLMGGNIMSSLYNVVDSLIVGNFVGSNALAAVGSCLPMNLVINGLLIGISIGASVLTGQYTGAKQHDEVSKAVNTTILLSTIVGVLMTFIGLAISWPIMRVLNTPMDIMDDAVAYLRITMLGLLGQMFYLTGADILRNMGDAKYPMIMVAVCSILNICLDLLFVLVFKMAVAGVGWATIISQLVSGILVMIRIYSSGNVTVNRQTMRLDVSKIKMIAKIGLPGAVQMTISSVGMLLIQRIGNGFGVDFVAAMSVAQKVDGFAMIPLQSLSQSVSPFVSQNIGAGKLDRVKRCVRFAVLGSLVLGVVLGAAMLLFGRNLIRAFNKNEAVIQMGVACVSIMAFGFWAMGLQQSLSGVVRGAGATFVPMLIMVGTTLARVPIAYLLAVIPNNFKGVFYSQLIASILGAVLIAIYYLSGKWKNKIIVQQRPETAGS